MEDRSNSDSEEIEPSGKLDELVKLLYKYNAKVYTNKDADYDYLEDGCSCITLKNQSDKELYIDLEEEFTLSYDAWHAHYFPDVCEYNAMLHDLNGLLNCTCCAFVVSSKNKWMCSVLLTVPPKTKDDAKKQIRKVLYEKGFIKKMQRQGAEAQCIFWNEKLNYKFTIAPNEI